MHVDPKLTPEVRHLGAGFRFGTSVADSLQHVERTYEKEHPRKTTPAAQAAATTHVSREEETVLDAEDDGPPALEAAGPSAFKAI